MNDHLMDCLRYYMLNKQNIKRIKSSKLFYKFARKLPKTMTNRPYSPCGQIWENNTILIGPKYDTEDPISGRIVEKITYHIDDNHGCIVKIKTGDGLILLYKVSSYDKEIDGYPLIHFHTTEPKCLH